VNAAYVKRIDASANCRLYCPGDRLRVTVRWTLPWTVRGPCMDSPTLGTDSRIIPRLSEGYRR
jgi:hypothetical protein